jgi:hypothetical protein
VGFTRRFYVCNPFGRLVRDVDIVFDTVGGETLKRSWSLLKPRGRMVTIAAESEGTKDERIEKAFFIVEPNQKELTEISRLLDSGELQLLRRCCCAICQSVRRLLRNDRGATRPREVGALHHHHDLAARFGCW